MVRGRVRGVRAGYRRVREYRRGPLALSRYCLDTSAYSHFRRHEPQVVGLISTARWIGCPAVMLGELRYGFRRGKRAEENERTLGRFLQHSLVHVLEVEEQASHLYADLMLDLRQAGTPVPTNDVWIASLSLREGATVLTYDQHFRSMRRVSARILLTPT